MRFIISSLLLIFLSQLALAQTEKTTELGESKAHLWKASHTFKDFQNKIIFTTSTGEVTYQPEDPSAPILEQKIIELDKQSVLVVRWLTGKAETVVILDPTAKKGPVVFEKISEGSAEFEYDSTLKKIKIKYIVRDNPEKGEAERTGSEHIYYWP